MRYDALCICLLVFSGILATWLGIFGPLNITTLKDWQPLGAAFVALIAAGGAYRSAVLKINQDKEAEQRADQRKVLGILLRLEFEVLVIKYEAENQHTLLADPESIAENVTVEVDKLSFSDPAPLSEAWSNLDCFMPKLAGEIYQIRNDLYNFNNYKSDDPNQTFRLEYGSLTDEEIEPIREIVKDLVDHSLAASRSISSSRLRTWWKTSSALTQWGRQMAKCATSHAFDNRRNVSHTMAFTSDP